ncbi:sodium-dependent transporter [Streptomyces sp. R21]|uniref:Sodium-dependent transporter n=1 Tax=Streptomyces sp. R21 TaxID=3238627 RepID=A0AB39PMG6_9ACTN
MHNPTDRLSPTDRATGWLRRRLGRAMALAYVLALMAPGPGLWLRHAHGLPLDGTHELPLPSTSLLLGLVLFSAGLQVPAQALGQLLRRPRTLLAGLVLHVLAPLLIIPLVAFLLRWTPDSDGGSGLITAMIMLLAMPVAAGATVWTGKGQGDQPTMVGLVLVSTLLSPLTLPVTVQALAPLLHGEYVGTVEAAGQTANSGFTLTGVVLPCAAGLACRLVMTRPGLARPGLARRGLARPGRARRGPSRPGLARPWLSRLLSAVVPTAMLGSLVLTYANAAGALGSFLAHPRPLLLTAALAVAAVVCTLSFATGRIAARVLRLDAPAASSLTLACGMNNSSASAVLITNALPDKPHLLLPVLAYGLLQKTAANRVVRVHPRLPPPGSRPG